MNRRNLFKGIAGALAALVGWKAKPASPGLERYRLAKAALAELELDQRVGSLLSRDKARGILSRWASIVRRLGERLRSNRAEVVASFDEVIGKFLD